MRGPGLDELIAAAYAVEVATGPVLAGVTRAEGLLAAAAQLAGLIGARRAVARAPAEPTWSALPARSGPAVDAAARGAALERMLAWAAAGGADADALEFRVDADGGCTAHARRPIAAGTRVVTVPRRLMIVEDDLAASSTGAVDPFGPMLRSARDTLAAWLPLEAARADSPWRPFLDVLPTALPDLPVFHGDADLDELAGTVARGLAAAAHEDIGSTYGLLQDGLQERVSLVDFAWGRAIVRSRGYNVEIGGEARVALIPIVDLLNHRPGDTTWSYHPDEAAYGITTLRAFETGDEVHATYGPYGNAKLLVGYGFALDDHGVDEAALVFAPAGDPCTDLAGHLVWRQPFAAPAAIAVGTRFDWRFRRALSVARLRAAPWARVRAAADRGLPGRELPWLGAAIERVALAELATAARAGIERLDENGPDVEPVGGTGAVNPAATSWRRACGLVRRGERALLQQILAFAAEAATHVDAADAATRVGVAEPEAVRRVADAVAAAQAGPPPPLVSEYLCTLADELMD